MTGNEVAIIIVAITFGSILGIVAIVKLAGLVKAWINRNSSSYDEEKFDRLAKAFIQYKKDTERRLKKLENGSGKHGLNSGTSKKELKEERLQDAAQIKPDDEKSRSQTESGNLRNMLRE